MSENKSFTKRGFKTKKMSIYAYSLTLPPHIINKSWISRKNDKAVKIMKKTQILLWKAIEGNSNRRLRVRVRVRFLLFYSELAPTDPWCNMLCDFTWTEKIWGGNARWTPSTRCGRLGKSNFKLTANFLGDKLL